MTLTAIKPHQNWLINLDGLQKGTGTAIASTKFYIALLTSSTINISSSLTSIIAAECNDSVYLASSGGGRYQVTWPAGTWNGTNLRVESTANVNFRAVGGTLQWSGAVLLANANPLPSQSFTSANVTTSTNRITITGHGYSAGSIVLPTADAGGTLPGGLDATYATLYQVLNPTANDFQLALTTSPSTPVTLSSIGSGTCRIRDANGIPFLVFFHDATEQRLQDQGTQYTINLGDIGGVY